MGLFLRIVIGIVIAVAGAAMVIKTQTLVDWFGYVDWAEQKIGGGGTRLFYKLLGILICFVGFMVATNLWDAFLQATLGSLIPSAPAPAATYAP